MTRERDNQRQRVYGAEIDAWSSGHGGKSYFQTIPNDGLKDYVASILDKRSVRSRWGVRPIPRIELTHGGARAFGMHEIRFGLNTRNEMIACHEVAHTLMADTSYAAHGPEYVGVYLFLVRLMMGDEWAKALSDSFRKHKVRRSNAAIPDVSNVVPQPRAERIREQKRAKRDDAARKIQQWLNDGVINRATLRAIIEGKAQS